VKSRLAIEIARLSGIAPKSSGHPELDDEVMAMILREQPLPPFQRACRKHSSI
jgi:hypothetical protein